MRERVTQRLQATIVGWWRRPLGQAGLALGVGLAVFALSYSLLGAARSARERPVTAEPAELVAAGTGGDSAAQRITPGRVALAAPVSRPDPLVSELRPGDRILVMAAIPGNPGEGSRAAVVVREAIVLTGPGTVSASSLLLEVSSDEAMVLAHLIQSGTRLTYALWPAVGVLQIPPAVDPATARARLGLESAATPVP